MKKRHKKKYIPEEMEIILEHLTIVYSKNYTKLVQVKKNKAKTVFKLDGKVKEHKIINAYLDSLEK